MPVLGATCASSRRQLSHASRPFVGDLEGQQGVDSDPLAADKIIRLNAQTAVIENGFGFVQLPDEAHWLADTFAELTAFPADRHEDLVDSTA